MDPLADQALDSLNAALGDLLPDTVPVGGTRSIRIRPERIRAGSLGGYVGQQVSPQAAVHARRISARVLISVSGGLESRAQTHMDEVQRTLATQDRGALQQLGFYRLRPHADADSDDARSLLYEVDFEFRQLPQAPDGRIDQLDVGLLLNPSSYRARGVLDVAGTSLVTAPDPLAEFHPVDDPQAGTPAGDWRYDDAEAAFRQHAATAGGDGAADDPLKAGSHLLWRPGGEALDVRRGILSIEFTADAPQGLGLVFGRRDGGALHYCLLSAAHGYHLVGRKRGGHYRTLALHESASAFTPGRRHRLTVAFFDQQLLVDLDDRRTLDLHDHPGVDGGEVGFLTHGNADVAFHRARLIELY